MWYNSLVLEVSITGVSFLKTTRWYWLAENYCTILSALEEILLLYLENPLFSFQCWGSNPGLWICYASAVTLNYIPSPWFFQTGSCYVTPCGLGLLILQPMPPECWDYRHTPLCPARIPSLKETFFTRHGSAHLLAQHLGGRGRRIASLRPAWQGRAQKRKTKFFY
jgi:hypothetical protein